MMLKLTDPMFSQGLNKAFVGHGSCDNVQTERKIFEYANWPRLQIKRTCPFSWSVQLVRPCVANCTCCKLHVLQIAYFANCTCCKLHLLQIFYKCKLHLLQIAFVPNSTSSKFYVHGASNCGQQLQF